MTHSLPLFHSHTVLSLQNILILHPLTQEKNKSKDIFDNNIPFTSLNCSISHPASIIFWERLWFSPSLESIDAYFSIYAYDSIIHATNLNKSYFFLDIHIRQKKRFPNLINDLEAIKSDQYSLTVCSRTNLSGFLFESKPVKRNQICLIVLMQLEFTSQTCELLTTSFCCMDNNYSSNRLMIEQVFNKEDSISNELTIKLSSR